MAAHTGPQTAPPMLAPEAAALRTELAQLFFAPQVPQPHAQDGRCAARTVEQSVQEQVGR